MKRVRQKAIRGQGVLKGMLGSEMLRSLPQQFTARVEMSVVVDGSRFQPLAGWELDRHTLRYKQTIGSHPNDTTAIATSVKAAELEGWGIAGAEQVKVSLFAVKVNKKGEESLGRVLGRISSKVYDPEHLPMARKAYK